MPCTRRAATLPGGGSSPSHHPPWCTTTGVMPITQLAHAPINQLARQHSRSFGRRGAWIGPDPTEEFTAEPLRASGRHVGARLAVEAQPPHEHTLQAERAWHVAKMTVPHAARRSSRVPPKLLSMSQVSPAIMLSTIRSHSSFGVSTQLGCQKRASRWRRSSPDLAARRAAKVDFPAPPEPTTRTFFIALATLHLELEGEANRWR